MWFVFYLSDDRSCQFVVPYHHNVMYSKVALNYVKFLDPGNQYASDEYEYYRKKPAAKNQKSGVEKLLPQEYVNNNEHRSGRRCNHYLYKFIKKSPP